MRALSVMIYLEKISNQTLVAKILLNLLKAWQSTILHLKLWILKKYYPMSSYSTKILMTHSNKTCWKIQLSWKFLKPPLQGMVTYIYIHLKKWYLSKIANSRLGPNLMISSIKSLALQWKISSILVFNILTSTGASIWIQWLMNRI